MLSLCISQVNTKEIEDARWFTRAEVGQMLQQQHPEGLFVARQHLCGYATRYAFGPWGNLLCPIAPAGTLDETVVERLCHLGYGYLETI